MFDYFKVIIMVICFLFLGFDDSILKFCNFYWGLFDFFEVWCCLWIYKCGLFLNIVRVLF